MLAPVAPIAVHAGKERWLRWVPRPRSFKYGMGYLGLASSRYWQWGGVAYLEHAASRLDLGPDAPPGHKGARERRIREIERHRVVEHPAHPLSIIAEAEPVLPMPPRRLGNDACRAILLAGAVPRKTCQGGGR